MYSKMFLSAVFTELFKIALSKKHKIRRNNTFPYLMKIEGIFVYCDTAIPKHQLLSFANWRSDGETHPLGLSSMYGGGGCGVGDPG